MGELGLGYLTAWKLTGDERYRAAARQAIDYERSLYSPSERNWPDLRWATRS